MPFSLAFKKYNPGDPEYSRLITVFTRSPFCHVECWIAGPQNNAICYSSREPDGVSMQHIDLSNLDMWEIVKIPTRTDQDQSIQWFCMGSSGKRYDVVDIAGQAFHNHWHDLSRRVCSEFCTEVVQNCIGLLLGNSMWDISPGGLYGLLESIRDVSPNPTK